MKKKKILKRFIFLIVCMLISISFYHFDQKESKTNKDYEVVRKMIWFGSKNETLEVKRNLKTKQCGWYLNGYRQKDYDGTENVSIMEFSMLDVNANQNAIEHQSKQDEGSKIIRDSLKNAESYYKYLVQSGRQILFENFSSNYFEAYLLNGDKMERFIYINKGKEKGVIIYTELTNGVKIPDINDFMK